MSKDEKNEKDEDGAGESSAGTVSGLSASALSGGGSAESGSESDSESGSESGADLEESEAGAAIIRAVAHVSVSEVPGLPGGAGADPLIGRTLGQFEVLERLGKGGMGVVYKARHQRLQRKVVALKVLSERHAGSVARRRLLEREAQNAHAVRHPNVAEIQDIVEADGTTFVVMEYVDGERLGTVVRAGRATLSEMVSYAQQIAEGLTAAHEERIVHRDLSPNNVMITRAGQVKILDFGLSKLLLGGEGPAGAVDVGGKGRQGGSGQTTLRGGGTPGYMSPEQARGSPVDVRTDVYSFGVLFKEMIAGAKGEERLKKAAEEIAAKCTRELPEERYSGGRELLVALRSLPVARPGRSRRGVVVAGVMIAATASTGLGAWWTWGRAGGDPRDSHVYVRGRSGPGCAADSGVTFKASAYMPTPDATTLRFFLTRDDDQPWTTPGKLTLFVGDGPTCAQKPFNVRKLTGEVVVGNKVQTLNLPIKPYDGEWRVGEEKRFWVGFEENGWLAYRTSGPVTIKHVGSAP